MSVGKGPGTARSRVTLPVMVLLVLLGLASAENTGTQKEDQRAAILKELVSIWRKGAGWSPHKEPPAPERSQEQQVHPVVRGIVSGLKSLGLLPGESLSLPSLSKSMDRHRLSGFLYNISLYLQEMGAELEERPPPSDEEQLWEKMLQSFLQSEGGAALNQWDGRMPPRPSVRLRDWFLSLRGSPHWDGVLGLLETLLSLVERRPFRPLLAFLSQNWRTLSALLEASLQALVGGTYGQASAALQGFTCALRGGGDCAFSVSWLQQLLRFLETKNWKPVVDLHPTGMRGDAGRGRLRPFSLPPEATEEEGLSGNASAWEAVSADEPGSVQTLLLQVLSRAGGGERAAQLAERNPALLQGLDDLRRGLLHRVGSSVYDSLRKKVSRVTMALLDDVSSVVEVPHPSLQGHCSVGDLRQLILWGIRHNMSWNSQALGFSSQGLPSAPPFLSCPPEPEGGGPIPPLRRSSTRPAPPSRHAPKQTWKHSRATHPPTPRLPLPQAEAGKGGSGYSEAGEEGYDLPSEAGYSAEILEAACNASIPGLTGVSNFTVFLYCNLFETEDGAGDSEVGQAGPDLHATCSDAAWYLSAAEDDFMWVHVCSEFFAHEFNNTVCANSSFWLQRAHQAALTKDYAYFNRSSIDDLCVQLSGEGRAGQGGGQGPDQACLTLLSSRSLSAQDFRHCFLPNNSALISALCGRESSEAPPSLPGSSWAEEYCSRVYNSSHLHPTDDQEPCDYRKWPLRHFTNSTLLERCGSARGFAGYVCRNATLYRHLLRLLPQLPGLCGNPAEPQEQDGKCVLQRFFDMLPARYDFDTSQLCAEPGPLLTGTLHRLRVCEVEAGEREGWVGAVGYVLRVLDFVVGLSAGLEEGEGDVRQGLGQAILLSSLPDNASFWATLRPDASLSVLHTVGGFLRREQNPALKEDLLSCFSPVLWDLIQRQNNSSALRVLMQEYLQMPKESIRTLVMSAEKDAVKRFLSHMHQSWDQLHVETTQASQKELQAMETMTSAFIHKFPRVTPDLFIDLSQFIPFMSVSDIMSFPASLMVNDSVLMAIRDHSSEMKSPQKQAFVKRLLQSSVVGDVSSWPPYFLSSILPLLPYLPLSKFRQLTSPQLSPMVELLGNSSLDGTRGRHVLRTLFTNRRNLTKEDILRLGVLACYLSPDDLRPFLQTSSPVSRALWQQLALCVTEGLISATGRLSLWVVRAVQPLNASTLPPPVLASLRGLLPQLGASFLQPLPSLELLDILTQPGLQNYSPAQAFQILSKISEDTNLTMDTLCRLQPLLPGLSPAVLGGLDWSGISGSVQCGCWRGLLAGLRPGYRALLHRTLQEVLDSRTGNSSLRLQCLLPFVPLRQLAEALDAETLLRDISLYKDLPWSHQQAQLLFRKIHQFQNITRETVEDMGCIAGGMTCDWLRLWNNESDFSELLQFVSELPGGLRPALRRCLVEELRRRPESDLDGLSPWFTAGLPVKMVEGLSNTSLRSVLGHIQQHWADFLLMPRHKQMALAERTFTALGSSQALGEGVIDGATVDLLGPLLPFLNWDTLRLVDRGALWLRLDEVRGYCLPRDALKDMANLLTQRDLLGEPSKWTVGDVEDVGRLVFTLSPKQINSIPLEVLSANTVEHLLAAQKRWWDSEVGGACVDQPDQREATQSLLRGIVRARSRRKKIPVPSCADIRGTFPSAWTANQLSRMAGEGLAECVEVVGQDASLTSDQRRTLWVKLRQTYSPVRGLRPEQLLGLGCLVTELGERELQETNLTDLGLLAQLGALTDWSQKKMRAAVLGVMRRRKLRVEQLGAVDIATLGHLICGLYPPEISRLDPYNLSLAVLFLRELTLPCSDQQMEALTASLSRPAAFGPVSTWGPEVFTEIGNLAAGLDDIVLSALVQEQVQGLTPQAIALIPPAKMAVVFSVTQLSWLSVEQAWAVTEQQWAELDGGQRQALGVAQYEGDVLLEHRGRNKAPTAQSSDLTVCLLALSCTLWRLL